MTTTHYTKKETVHLLCRSIVTRLENHKAISFPVRLRQIVGDEIFHLVGPFILTDEDIRDKTLAKIGAKASVLEDSQFTDSAQYKTAKAMVRQTLGEHELNGFYFQKPIKTVAETIVQYLMRSSHIDDVYETDEDLEQQIVEVVQKFNPTEVH
jgi:hypothetical protein